MQVNVLSQIRNADFPVLPEKIDFLHFDLKQTADIFNKMYWSDKYERAIGEVTVKSYQQNPYFHLKTDCPTENNQEISNQELSFIQGNSRHIYNNLETFVMCLWFIKDNSTYLSDFHSYIPETNHVITITTLGNIYSNSTGIYNQRDNYTIDDLNRTLKFFVKYNEACTHNSIKMLPRSERPKPFQALTHKPYNFNKITRIERAIHFLKLARRSSQLYLKISFYICLYETLFSSIEKVEIAHTICERLALYYGFFPDHRLSVYSQLKEAYGIRSTYFHGQSFDTKEYKKEDFETIAKNLDNLTRSVLIKVLLEDVDIFNQKGESLEKSFKDLIFSEREEYGITVESKPDFIPFRNVKHTISPNL